MRAWRLCLALCALALAATLQAQPLASRLLDDFEDLSRWQASGSDQVRVALRSAPGARGRALCLDYDFNGVSGYAVARRELPLDFPARYALQFQVRGEAPSNQFQLKFVDASGDNVWWRNLGDFTPPRQWQTLTARQRQIEFAWGPTADKLLRHSAAVEFVVASGQGGGKGSVCVDELQLHTLPADEGPPPAPRLRASQSAPGHAAALAMDGDAGSSWQADARRPQQLQVDLGRVREFGGLVLHWRPGAQATRYALELSEDGRHWTTARSVVQGGRSVQPLLLTESAARYLRLRLQRGAGPRYALAELELKDLAWGASRNSFLQAVAQAAPRGHYPRGWRGEQPYWTVVGVDGGARHSALFSEDGAVEVGKGGFSVEPFLVLDEGVLSWAEVQINHSLAEGYLPLPGVHWRHPRVGLDITAFAAGEREHAQLITRYRVHNPGPRPLALTLALALRPLQVNPATQFLNEAGGASTVHTLAQAGRALAANGQPRLWPLAAPADVIGTAFDGGELVPLLTQPGPGHRLPVADAFGAASAALRYRLTLAPGEVRTVSWVAPLAGAFEPPTWAEGEAWAEARQAEVSAAWRERLNRVGLQLPRAAQPLADTLRSAHAQMLVSRDGPALQPGTRSYARAWVRDGVMMAEGLLRLGEVAAARDFVRWYAPHQFASGKVPCCVDRRGADPVVENDSHGQLIFGIHELWRYTGDEAEARRLWPHVAAAIAHMDALRASERSEANRQGERAPLYGLLPASISHEGYAAKPMHSYWDDFWALRGYKDAAALALQLGEPAAPRIAAARDEFAADLQASIRASMAQHRIDFIPGAAELGDFDATSTTIALAPGGELQRLPPVAVAATFERYWQQVVARREGRLAWTEYTPYELRNVGAFVRLGWRERAQALLQGFMADRRPAAWNQFAEVVGRDAREPRFVGDMPHAWIASDYIRAVLDLLACEREHDQALVLAAGVPPTWWDEGVVVRGLATPFGRLSYRLRREGARLQLDVQDGLHVPPGGLVLAWPGDGPLPAATVGGQPAAWQGRELRLRQVPVSVQFAVGEAR